MSTTAATYPRSGAIDLSVKLLVLLCGIVLACLSHGQRFGQPVKSPEVASDGKVTFRFRAPNAAQAFVVVEGLPRLEMAKDEKGNWSATTAALAPDLYSYSFVVDGVAVADPANHLRKPVITGGHESVVHVPGPASLSWEIADVARGAVHRHAYRSKTVGEDRQYWVYTPPGYDARARETYPTLYLLHGVMETAEAWLATGRANVILDNLIAQKKAKPMVVVMPLGYGFANAPDNVGKQFGPTPDQRTLMDAVTRILLEEIVPHVEKGYRVSRERAIAGLSLGGAQALFIGLNHSDKFSSVASFGAAVIVYGAKYEPWFPALDSSVVPKPKLLMVACAQQDFLYGPNKKFREWLTSKGLKCREFDIQGGHTWMVWRRDLTELLPLLFR